MRRPIPACLRPILPLPFIGLWFFIIVLVLSHVSNWLRSLQEFAGGRRRSEEFVGVEFKEGNSSRNQRARRDTTGRASLYSYTVPLMPLISSGVRRRSQEFVGAEFKGGNKIATV